MPSSSSNSGGQLVRVALVQNEMEAELIRGLLADNGIPSMVRRTTGFGDWTLTSAGPQEVVVPEGAVEKAREVLASTPGGD